MIIIYQSSLVVFSILVPILAIALAVLSFIPFFIQIAKLRPKWESLISKCEFAKDVLRNCGLAGGLTGLAHCQHLPRT